MGHIVAPKLIRKKDKRIEITCGGKECSNKTTVIYGWNDKGKDRLICNKCGRANDFEIPE
jgi:hypothetical protein